MTHVMCSRLRPIEVPDDDLAERLEAARRRALPIPWAPPMPGIDWIPYRRVYRQLVAEAVASRLRGLTPALESANLPGCAFEIERVIRILEAVPFCTADDDVELSVVA
jgi:hypothetical protein